MLLLYCLSLRSKIFSHSCSLTCPLQVEDITQALTPLFRTFLVGILQNPFTYEALQNFTTSPSTQGLMSGLRNATELGLPALQRVLVRAFLLLQLISLCWPPLGKLYAIGPSPHMLQQG